MGWPIVVAAIGVVIVAITGANAGAAYLILSGLLAIALGIRLGPEGLEAWREERARKLAKRP
jgi:hypothetical protein